VKTRENLVKVSESLQSVTALRDLRGPQLADDADRSSTSVVQSLDVVQASEIVRMQTEREKQVVLFLNANLAFERPSPLPDHRVETSGDPVRAARLIGSWRKHVNVVAIADDVLKFVAAASRNVTGEVPHRKQQHPARDLW
jgi:hypothetical protein